MKKIESLQQIFRITSIAILISLSFSGNSWAEVITGTNLSVHFESANIVGSGRNINMNRVPVIDTNTGVTTYYDAAFRFTFTPGVGLEFVTISSAAISPPLSTSNLVAGKYKDQNNREYTLEGPSSVSGSRLFYTLKSVQVNGTFSANIITGPAVGHPDIGQREIVPFLPDTFNYGLISNRGNQGEISNAWEINELIGVRQNGNNLLVTLLSDGVNNDGMPVDFTTQVDGATLTRIDE